MSISIQWIVVEHVTFHVKLVMDPVNMIAIIAQGLELVNLTTHALAIMVKN